jgi:2-polyprenyl-3-methyl-5-hydroxy-6-metoxy-1,4-benzoquinol methylase
MDAQHYFGQMLLEAKLGTLSEQTLFQARQALLTAGNQAVAEIFLQTWLQGREAYWRSPLQASWQLCVQDACFFLHVDQSAFLRMAADWQQYVEQFSSYAQPEAFYRAFTGSMGRSNLCANIVDQFSRQEIITCLQSIPDGVSLADVGCGSAALSLPLASRLSHLFLLDLPNLAQDFVLWRMARYALTAVTVGEMAVWQQKVDVVLCVDVLEHIAHASAFFRQMDARLRTRGLLIVRMPWYSQFPHREHLPEAEENWLHQGGAELLQRQYRLLQPIEYGGLYEKI